MSGETARLRLSDDRWVEFVASHPDAVAFHHPAWAQGLAETYGLRGFVLARRESGRVTAGIPFLVTRKPLGGSGWVSLPRSHAVPRWPVGTISISSWRTWPRPHARPMSRASNYVPRIDAEDWASVWQPYSTSSRSTTILTSSCVGFTHRRCAPTSAARSADRSRFAALKDMRDLTEHFYGLHTRARRRQGIPVQPRRFFEVLWRRMIDTGLGYCLLAEIDSKPVAGAVFLTWNGTTTYKFGASDPVFLKYRPNHLIFWHAIQSASADGHHAFDFGSHGHRPIPACERSSERGDRWSGPSTTRQPARRRE